MEDFKISTDLALSNNSGVTENLRDDIVRLDKSHKARFSMTENKVHDLLETVQSLTDSVSKLQKKYDLLSCKYDLIKNDYKSLQSEHNTLKNTVKQLETKLTNANEERQQSADARGPAVPPEIQEVSTNTSEANLLQQENAEQCNIIHSSIPLNNKFEAFNHPTHVKLPPKLVETQTPHQPKQHKPETETCYATTFVDKSSEVTRSNHVVILSDSNGKFIDTDRICKGSSRTANIIRCYTVAQAQDVVNSHSFTPDPEEIIIHTGTNDLEHSQSNDEISKQISDLLINASNTFPNTTIYYSLLLPRKDFHDRRIPLINQLIKVKIDTFSNVRLINHDNIDSSALHDNKHLNKRVGVPLFARNLILALNGKPTGSLNPKKRQPLPNQSQGKPFQYEPKLFPPLPHAQVTNNQRSNNIKHLFPTSYSGIVNQGLSQPMPPMASHLSHLSAPGHLSTQQQQLSSNLSVDNLVKQFIEKLTTHFHM